MTGPIYVKLLEISEILGLPAQWIKYQSERKKIPHLFIGRSRYFDVEAVRATLADPSFVAASPIEEPPGDLPV